MEGIHCIINLREEESIVEVDGELSFAFYESTLIPWFEQNLAKLDANMILDLSKVGFLDADGVEFILKFLAGLSAKGKTLKVVATENSQPKHTLEMIGLRKLLQINTT